MLTQYQYRTISKFDTVQLLTVWLRPNVHSNIDFHWKLQDVIHYTLSVGIPPSPTLFSQCYVTTTSFLRFYLLNL